MCWFERLSATSRSWLAALVVAAWSVASATTAMAGPPVGGAMADFIAHAEPKPAPEVSFQDGDGESRTLADFEGRVVLLNFWATWCGPCKIEMPDLDALQAELGGERFEVVALSGDRAGLKAVDTFYEEIGVEHLARYVDKTMASHRAFETKGLPTTVLLDAQGREVGRLTGAAHWASDEAKALMRWYIDRVGE